MCLKTHLICGILDMYNKKYATFNQTYQCWQFFHIIWDNLLIVVFLCGTQLCGQSCAVQLFHAIKNCTLIQHIWSNFNDGNTSCAFGHGKSQLISECPFGVIVLTKKPTKFKDFCPCLKKGQIKNLLIKKFLTNERKIE